MQKRRGRSILQKVSNLFKTSIFIARMRKPIVAKLIFLKKSRKLKRFKLLKHYKHYGFLSEYQFSASSTPLIHYHRRQVNYLKKYRSSFQDIYSMFFFCKCFGGAAAAADYSPWVLETPPAAAAAAAAGVNGDQVLEPLDLEDDQEDDSVDQRAEKFIEWFYQEMRMQRQDSI